MKKELLSASTSGKNEAKRGLMDRLRGFFYTEADAAVHALSSPLMLPEMYEYTPAADL